MLKFNPFVSVEPVASRLPDGTVWYGYSVTNHTTSPIVAVRIGYDAGRSQPELQSAPLGWQPETGIPASNAETPIGWQVYVITAEEQSLMQVEWRVLDNAYAIAPGWQVTKFYVLLPFEDTAYMSGHWSVILDNGIVRTGQLGAVYIISPGNWTAD